MPRSFSILPGECCLSHLLKRHFALTLKMALPFAVKPTSIQGGMIIQTIFHPSNNYAWFLQTLRVALKLFVLFDARIPLLLGQEISIPASYRTCLCQTLLEQCVNPTQKRCISVI